MTNFFSRLVLPARHLRLTTGALLLSTSFIVAAQEPNDGAKTIPEIIVTAKGEQTLSNVLATSHLFTASDIERIQAKDVTTLLRQVAGINITDTGGRGSTTGVFLRGASSAQTIILIDGVRVGSATLGSAALNSFPLEAIQRIEVVKGPLSGIYGADAVGGVIQLFTGSKRASGAGFSGVVGTTFGSDSLREYDLTLRSGSDLNNIYISAQTEETDGIDRTSIISGGNGDIDGYEQSAFSFGGRTQLSSITSAKLALLYSDNSVEFDNTFGDDTGFFTDTNTFSSALSINSELNPDLSWRSVIGFNNDDSETPAFDSNFETDRYSVTSELVYRWSAHHSLTAGLDFYDEQVSPSETFPETDRDNKGVYAVYQAGLGKFDLVANLRLDDNSAYGNDMNGSAAIDYAFNQTLRAVLSYGTAFVAPSFNSLYFPFFGNPDLRPEESESLELSLRGSSSDLAWRVSAYRTDITNLFSFDPETFLAANIGSAELEGIEAEISSQWAGWQLAASVGLQSAIDKDSGIELDDRAQQNVVLQADKSWRKLDLRLAIHGESGRFDNRGTELPSYALVDVNVGYKINDSLSLRAVVNNLFDKDYTVNLIGPNQRYLTEGRQARLRLKYQF